MSAKVSGKSKSLGDAIISELTAYKTEIQERIDESAKKHAKKLQQEIKTRSPEKTGAYKKGWHVKKYGKNTYLVHNKDKWQLTHLLEEGHAINDGTARAPAYPHIEPAREKIEASYFQDVEEAIKDVGK